MRSTACCDRAARSSTSGSTRASSATSPIATTPAAAVIRPGYLDEGWTPAIGPDAGQVGRSGQVRDKVGAAHYPLASLVNRLLDAGFEIGRAFEGGAPTPITLSLLTVKPDGAEELSIDRT